MFTSFIAVGIMLAPPPGLTGHARLTCKSQWHQLDVALRADQRRVPGSLTRLFTPPAGKGERSEWRLSGPRLDELLAALHETPWNAATNADAYAHFLGSGPTAPKRTAAGSILVKRVGDRLSLSGVVRVADEGNMGNRFGPNPWRDEWTHRFDGEARLSAGRQVAALRLRDEFTVAGSFGTEPNSRKGTLTIADSPPRDLPENERQELSRLLARIAGEDFDARELASAELLAWGRADSRILPALRDALADDPDPETARRVERIVRRLSAVEDTLRQERGDPRRP